LIERFLNARFSDRTDELRYFHCINGARCAQQRKTAMTMTKIAFAALLLAGVLAAPAQAKTTDSEFSPDEVNCSFVADAGAYVCDVTIQPGASSLTLPQDGWDRRGRPTLTGPIPVGTVVGLPKLP
jgi:hypothetical protein